MRRAQCRHAVNLKSSPTAATSTACLPKSAIKHKCAPGKGRRFIPKEHEHILEAVQRRLSAAHRTSTISRSVRTDFTCYGRIGDIAGRLRYPAEERACSGKEIVGCRRGVEQRFDSLADVGIRDIGRVPATEGEENVCSKVPWPRMRSLRVLRSQSLTCDAAETDVSFNFVRPGRFRPAGQLWPNAKVAEFLRREVI
jgi:hypothetical protein